MKNWKLRYNNTWFIVFDIVASSEPNSKIAENSLRESKHRPELDEAVPEQKDALLEMLEVKLKEITDKKRKKKILDKLDTKLSPEQRLCQGLARDQGLVLRANGISNVGILNLLMNHGPSGKGVLNLDSDGISNVGRAHLELGMEGGVNIPGISSSLLAAQTRFKSIFCDNQDLIQAKDSPNSEVGKDDKSLRKTDVNNLINGNETVPDLDNRVTTVIAKGTGDNATDTVATDAEKTAPIFSTASTTNDANDIIVSVTVKAEAPKTTASAVNNLNTVSK